MSSYDVPAGSIWIHAGPRDIMEIEKTEFMVDVTNKQIQIEVSLHLKKLEPVFMYAYMPFRTLSTKSYLIYDYRYYEDGEDPGHLPCKPYNSAKYRSSFVRVDFTPNASFFMYRAEMKLCVALKTEELVAILLF